MRITERPLLICMTPVRNEAWVLNAFLKTTSLWADYIIVADQLSTDGSKEIALSYPKVIYIENNSLNFNEADRQKLLIKRAREISGDKILFALDADEIFSANYFLTEDWRKIINSKPGEVFFLQWAQISTNMNEYWIPNEFFPWIIHDKEDITHDSYVRNIHSMRIPYSDNLPHFYITDFKVLHLQYVNSYRNLSKQRFYLFVDYELNNRSIVSLARTYLPKKISKKKYQIEKELIYHINDFGFNLFELIDIQKEEFWFDKYILDKINKDGNIKYCKIDIWQKQFIKKYHLKDPRNFVYRLIHIYLRVTQDYSNFIFIKVIDKILKIAGI